LSISNIFILLENPQNTDIKNDVAFSIWCYELQFMMKKNWYSNFQVLGCPREQWHLKIWPLILFLA
jgi:hypothetical protein